MKGEYSDIHKKPVPADQLYEEAEISCFRKQRQVMSSRPLQRFDHQYSASVFSYSGLHSLATLPELRGWRLFQRAAAGVYHHRCVREKLLSMVVRITTTTPRAGRRLRVSRNRKLEN